MTTQTPIKQRAPLYEVTMYDPSTDTRAFLIIDTLKQGIAGGGIRMMPTVTMDEVHRLAKAMTHKFSAVNIPMGGSKSGIVADPNSPDKQKHLEAFAKMAKPFLSSMYIAGEDMGTTADDVGFLYETADCSWVKVASTQVEGFNMPSDFDPTNFHGVNLEVQLTGFGVAESCEEACRVLGLVPSNATVAIQGFGTVGSVTAKNLVKMGFKITTISDVLGTIHHPDGLPIDALIAIKDDLGTVDRDKNNFDCQQLHRDEWLAQDADILIPAALADTITMDNVGRVNAKLIVEGANIPITEAAEQTLFERDIAIVPDFIANAGAAGGFGLIITAQVEQNPDAIFAELGKRMRTATRDVLESSRQDGVLPREVAVQLAESRL
jgi:glutamate dehydrogenase/leucine dehydrogenase